jgi:hypothetical protein
VVCWQRVQGEAGRDAGKMTDFVLSRSGRVRIDRAKVISCLIMSYAHLCAILMHTA